MKLAALLVVMVTPGCLGYPSFQDAIPNGKMVPHPCKVNYMWQGVGHFQPGGGGSRNSFGKDFNQNGKVWDSCICNFDSDGDGKTNGEELGDPDCVWTPGKAAERTTGLSHPGLCEPIDSPDCQIKNKDFGDFCNAGDEVNPCIDGVKNQAGVESLTISFPETPVPGEVTTYVCQVFALPSDTDYHIIAQEPYIVNKDVMHHILVYGCKDSAVVTDAPQECGMAESDCRDLIAAWGVGANGNCLNENFGFRIGLTGYKTVLMQAHWNNPELRTDYTDSSGMVLYYTPNLRPNDGAMMMTGQNYLAIPGGESDFMVSGTCPKECTAALPHSIFIAESLIHMHYLGSRGYIEHSRNGTKVTDLVYQDVYSYDTPIFFNYDTPVEFRPGDAIKTTCHFKSTGKTETTYFGEATNAEMCFGFLSYYPKIMEATDCVAYSQVPVCGGAKDVLIGSCNMTAFFEVDDPYYEELAAACDVTGQICNPACDAVQTRWKEEQPCLHGEALTALKNVLRDFAPEYAEALINFMESCEAEDNSTPKEEDEMEVEKEGSQESSHSHQDEGPLCPAENNSDNDKKPTSSASVVGPALVWVTLAILGAVVERL